MRTSYLSCEEYILDATVLDLGGDSAWTVDGRMRKTGDRKLEAVRNFMHDDIVGDICTGRVARW